MPFYSNRKLPLPSTSSFVKVPTDTLLIVESPAKCSTIVKHLGPGYRCIATIGHMRHIDGLDSIDMKNNYKIKFSITESKKSQIKKIESEIKMSARILLATDDDREGEAIAWHICEIFRLSLDKTERIVFHEITKDALEYAIKHPRTVNMNLVYSSHARQILDLLIGYKISPFLWKHVTSSDKTLSAGRCQTPALRIVYENEVERLERLERLNENTTLNEKNIDINNHRINSHLHSSSYSVIGFFTRFNLPFSLSSSFETCKLTDLDTFLNASIREDTQFKFKHVSQKPSTHITKSPEPFTTSRLQQMASNEFALSPSETMEICQKLYERGYITYIRTTGTTYSAEFVHNHALPFIREKWGDAYANSQLQLKSGSECIDNDTVSAHEAIRPTDIMRFGLTGDYHTREQKIYKLIWRNIVESCMTDYTFSSLEIAVETNILIPEKKCHDTECFYTFFYTCHKPIFYGWKAVQGFTVDQEKQHGALDYLQNIRNNSDVSCNRIETNVVFSSHGLPSHYTEARLIQSLEEKEIGRPSTFSTIIEKIKEREYVKKNNVKGECVECIEHTVSFPEKKISQIISKREFGNEKNKLIVTSLGKSVCTFLISHFPRIFSYDYTRQMEADLDNIACCKKSESPSTPIDILKRVCDECCREIRENIHKYNLELKEKIENIETSNVELQEETNDTLHKNNENNNNAFIKTLSERIIGTYGGFDVLLKNGRFGKYIVWGKNGEQRKSIEKTHLRSKNISDVTLDEVIRVIENDINDDVNTATSSTTNEGVIRVINDDVSIRCGKYGNYIFYKTMQMKKPKFISLKNFQKNVHTCSEGDFLSLL